MGERVVKWKQGWTEGEFLAAVVRAGGLESGSVVAMDYLHDAECPKPTGGVCRCDAAVQATILIAGAA